MHNPAEPVRTAKLLAAGTLALGTIPFTIAVLEGINQEIGRRQEILRKGGDVMKDMEVEKGRKAAGLRGIETRVLVERWARLNLVRVGMALSAALVGFSAL